MRHRKSPARTRNSRSPSFRCIQIKSVLSLVQLYPLCMMIPADFLRNTFPPTLRVGYSEHLLPLTELKPSELSLDPIRADALILLQSDDDILHIEFQTVSRNSVPFRMLDYRVRGYRKYPNKNMRQVVMYLKQTGSELFHQTSFTMERTRHEFEVIRLWEQPASLFLE